MGADDFAAQLATAATLNQTIGREETRKAILQWANANKDALKQAGLIESLLRACGQ